MSQRNKNNSIIFLTTLSVYLGLMLVGGAMSPVLAQAALTRNFDVQDEIEVKDNLDKKPDDTEVEGSLASSFPALFAQLLNEIQNEVESGRFSLPVQTEFIVHAQYSSSGMCSVVRVGSDISDSDFSGFFAKAINEKFESKIFKITDLDSGKSKSGKVQIEANNSGLSLKISFTKLNAKQFAEFLNQEFSSSAVSIENILTKQIYENTKVTSENNQVFIVTRLPRGSLDEFLKQGAKADNQ